MCGLSVTEDIPLLVVSVVGCCGCCCGGGGGGGVPAMVVARGYEPHVRCGTVSTCALSFRLCGRFSRSDVFPSHEKVK